MFSYMRTESKYNPAAVLASALMKNELEPRVAEALPWLAFTYSDMDWDWVVREAKLNDAANRLGFVVTLARQLAQRKSDSSVAQKLADVEAKLERSRLAREDTLCHEEMTQAERRWLRSRSTPEAQRWNVLSDLSVEQVCA